MLGTELGPLGGQPVLLTPEHCMFYLPLSNTSVYILKKKNYIYICIYLFIFCSWVLCFTVKVILIWNIFNTFKIKIVFI